MLDRAESDDAVRAVLVTGRGRAFCAGQDLAEIDESDVDGRSLETRLRLETLQHLTRRMLRHRKVLVAAINGVAVGFGAEVALACAIRVASTAARIGFVEVTRALFETNGVMWLLPWIVGHGVAVDVLLSGEIVGAEEVHRIGLVSRLVAPDDLAAAAHEISLRVAANAPILVRLVKDVLRTTWRSDLATVMEADVDASTECLASEDVREDTRAFLDKRPLVYRGR